MQIIWLETAPLSDYVTLALLSLFLIILCFVKSYYPRKKKVLLQVLLLMIQIWEESLLQFHTPVLVLFFFLIKQMDCSAQAQLSFSYSRAAAQWQLLTEENVSRIQGLIFLPRQILYLCELWLHLDNIVTLQVYKTA